MRFLAAVFATLCLSLNAQARDLPRDLPEGEFALLGPVLPGIQTGHIVPIYVHVKTGGDRLDWTFLRLFAPYPDDCEQSGRCQHEVQALSHQVTWEAEGGLAILSTERRTGAGLVIDREDIDGAYILNPVHALVKSGKLDLTAQGGTLTLSARRVTSRAVQLVPATLAELRQALDLMVSFEQSMARLNQCGLRQILAIQNSATRTAPQQQVLDAARFAGALARLEAALQSSPDDAQSRVLSLQRGAYRLASVVPQRAVVEAAEAGKRLSDPELLALAREAVAPVAEDLAEDLPEEVLTELFETRQAELLATLRYFARYAAAMQAGEDPLALLCRDITLAR